MKRKILSFVLALCLIIPCALVFTACKKDEDTTAKTVFVASETELRDALTASTGDSVIKLSQDINLASGIEVRTTAVLNLNGKTLTATQNSAQLSLFIVVGNGRLTIEGEGTINSATQSNDYSMAIWARDGGKVVINGGIFTNVGAKAMEDNGTTPNNNELIYVSADGEVIINNGVFVGNTENTTYGTKYTLNKKDNTNAVLIVKGGMYKEFNPANNLAEGPSTNFVAEGYHVVSSTVDTATWYTVVVDAE